MARAVLVLRPEPGNAATCAALRLAGLNPIALPLFTIAPVAWQPPAAHAFDALLLTSAHAVRTAGAALTTYAQLPCVCVGQATAAAAVSAGLTPSAIGDAMGAQPLLDAATPGTHWVWLCGADHRPLVAPPPSTLTAIVTYQAEPSLIPHQPPVPDPIVMVHSPAAALALQSLPWVREGLHIVVGSSAIAAAVGTGWKAVDCAASPLDRDMVELVAKLWQI